MKRALKEGPVISSVVASSIAFRSYKGGILDSVNDCFRNSTKLDHAVLVIGYGKEKGTNNKGQIVELEYLIVKNSFGDKWGMEGFAKIAIFDPNMPFKIEVGVCGILNDSYQVRLNLPVYLEKVQEASS
mmetsp:Transcript_8443/g.14158  ORF Transcript_8443/g.14158 Transcript_8443/m.14158 type:complete len:129 (+) Transcript_8443:1095-1481(+)